MAKNRNVKKEDHPHNELTHLCAKLIDVLENEPNGEDVRAIVMLSRKENDDNVNCGIGSHGFEGGKELIQQLIQHCDAIIRAYGGRLHVGVVPTGAPPEMN